MDLRFQYGLKQAGREWHLLLVNWLVRVIGLEKSKAEPCVFRELVNGNVELMVGVHVDDIIVCGEKDDCNKFLDELRQRFPVKNKGVMKRALYGYTIYIRRWCREATHTS